MSEKISLDSSDVIYKKNLIPKINITVSLFIFN